MSIISKKDAETKTSIMRKLIMSLVWLPNPLGGTGILTWVLQLQLQFGENRFPLEIADDGAVASAFLEEVRL